MRVVQEFGGLEAFRRIENERVDEARTRWTGAVLTLAAATERHLNPNGNYPETLRAMEDAEQAERLAHAEYMKAMYR